MLLPVFSPMSFEEALKASAGRLLLVDATAEWCPPCQRMERETWPDAAVTAWVQERGLAVQVDVDRDGDAARELGIEAMPTLVLFRDGKEIARHVGGIDAQDLLAWLNQHAG